VLSGKIFYRRLPFAFVPRREIKSPEELRGKRLAISRFGSSSDVTTRMLLKYWNLDPEKYVRILQVAGTTRLPAIISGQIDGTLVGAYDVPQILESGCCRSRRPPRPKIRWTHPDRRD
jgi:TRAP-type uncharacterized transport system substrate-binding protein